MAEAPTAAPALTETRLARGDEFRFEVAADSTVNVVLTNGTAEAFGAELATQCSQSRRRQHPLGGALTLSGAQGC